MNRTLTQIIYLVIGLSLINLNGQTKLITREITEYRITEKFGELVDEKSGSSTERFSIEGELLEGGIDSISYEFGSKGRMIGKDDYKNGVFYTKTKFVYDSNGHLTEENVYNSRGSLETKTKYQNDSKGQKTESHVFDGNGKEIGLSRYKYDSKGNVIETKGMFIVGNQLMNTRLNKSYDSKNRMIKRNTTLITDSREVPLNELTYEYNDKGLLIEELENELSEKFGEFVKTPKTRKKYSNTYYDYSDGSYKNGVKNGTWMVYVDDNKVRQKVYSDNVKNGQWTWWNSEGVKTKEGNYVSNLESGLWSVWYENGNKSLESSYKDGKLDGKWTEWYSNGQKNQKE